MRLAVNDFRVVASNDDATDWDLKLADLIPLVAETDYSDEFDRAANVTRIERKAA